MVRRRLLSARGFRRGARGLTSPITGASPVDLSLGLVERLRVWSDGPETDQLVNEAADEIERLRGIVPEVLERLNDDLCAENKLLRAALRIAREGYASEEITGLPVTPVWRDRTVALIDEALKA